MSVGGAAAFATTDGPNRSLQPRHVKQKTPKQIIGARKNDDDNDKSKKFKDSRDKRIEDLLEIERLAAESNQTTPSRLFEAISRTFWAVLGLGLVLNAFGYGLVVSKDGVKVDTLASRQFQQELVKPASKNR